MLGAILAIVSALAGSGRAVADRTQARAFQDLTSASSTAVDITYRQGFPRLLSLDVAMSGADEVERAQNFLSEYADLYRIDDPDIGLEWLTTYSGHADFDSEHTVVFFETYKGFPIFGSQLAVEFSLDALGSPSIVSRVNGSFSVDFSESLDLVPAISSEMAINVATTHKQRPESVDSALAKLMIFDPTVLEATANPRLVWRVTLTDGEPYQLLIDANLSDVVFEHTLSQTHNSGLNLDLEHAALSNTEDTNCFNPTTIDDQIADEDAFYLSYLPDPESVYI